MSQTINNRYDFVLLFDVKDGNPNGDPDAGNLPRVDPETGHGLVTDVCLKRKVRNYVVLAKQYLPPFNIYIREKAVLGRAHVTAFQELGIQLGESSSVMIDEEIANQLEEIGLPDGLRVEIAEDDSHSLIIEGDADKKVIKSWMKEMKVSKELKQPIDNLLKTAKTRKPKAEEVEIGRVKMCKDYYDIRTFGAVLSLKSAPNCGQVRGPVQMTFSRSIDQVVTLEHSITRMAVATEAEAEKQQGDNRTMGRKFTVPYGLYRCHGFVSAPLAKQTGFSQEDLDLLWDALKNMFEHDHSAARGHMVSRKLYVFRHGSEFGNAPSHKLFELVKVARKGDNQLPPRGFEDYEVRVTGAVPAGVELVEML